MLNPETSQLILGLISSFCKNTFTMKSSTYYIQYVLRFKVNQYTKSFFLQRNGVHVNDISFSIISVSTEIEELLTFDSVYIFQIPLPEIHKY